LAYIQKDNIDNHLYAIPNNVNILTIDDVSIEKTFARG